MLGSDVPLIDFDRYIYEAMLVTHPEIVENIKKYLDAGGTARSLERRLNWRYGTGSVITNTVACIAYYLERKRK